MSSPLHFVPEISADQWALATFGACDFGNIARTKSVIRYAAAQAKNPSVSTDRACGRDSAAAESGHRMLRSDFIAPQRLLDGTAVAAWQRASERPLVLAIEDTTGQSFRHSVAKDLGNQNAAKNAKSRGWMVHSVLLVDGQTREPLGLGYQNWWRREDKRPGKATRKQRLYEDKESFKWQAASERMSLMADLSNVISVADREADIGRYLEYKTRTQQRFVVRSAQSHSLFTQGVTLHRFMEDAEVRGVVTFEIPQSHSVPARTCTATIQYEQVELRCLKRLPCKSVTVVRVCEFDEETKEPLEWILLTSEPVHSLEEAIGIVAIYKQRWQVEVFHRTWKTGCNAKNRRLLRADNLQRMLIILANIAVFLMQVQHVAAATPEAPCTTLLSTDEWQCLHAITKPNVAIPQNPPSCSWAMVAIAKIAGWKDSKGTGVIGPETLWNGWLLFQAHVAGWLLAQQHGRRPEN